MANYAVASDLYNIFGEANVKEWANMEELATSASTYDTTVAARILAALTYATNDIDDYLRDGPYAIPFTIVPEIIKLCCCYKGGCWLFEWRRDDEKNDRYKKFEERANKILEEIKRGARTFDSTVQTVKGTRVPGVV